MAWTSGVSTAPAFPMGHTVRLRCQTPCSLALPSAPTEWDKTTPSVLSQVLARHFRSRPPHSATLVTLIRHRYSITTCLSDNSTRCKCHATKTCSRSALIQMRKTTTAVHLQSATCQRRSSRQWTTAHLISTQVTSGRRTCPISSIPCKRATLQDRLARR